MSVWVLICTVYLTLSLVRTASYRLLHDCETESSDAEIKIKNTVEKENLASLAARLETVFFLHHRYDAQSIKES